MVNESKHIVFLTPGFPSNEEDDTCIPPLQLFAKELARKKGIKLTVITFHYPYQAITYDWHGVYVRSFGMKNKHLAFRLPMLLKVKNYLKKLHQKTPIDVLHSFWLSDTAWVGERFAKRYKVNHFITLMGQDVEKSNRYVRYVSPQKPMVFLSEYHYRVYVVNHGQIDHALIPWGIKEKEALDQSKEIDIIAVGSLTELKNYTLLIDVVAALKSAYPKLSVSIVGEGPQREMLEEKSKDLQLDHIITFHGKMSNQEVDALMAKSKVFVHTSRYESFGNVFIEALNNKLPIVSNKVGIASPNEHWKLASTKNEFVEGLTYFLDHKLVSHFPKKYSIEHTVDEYMKFWERNSSF